MKKIHLLFILFILSLFLCEAQVKFKVLVLTEIQLDYRVNEKVKARNVYFLMEHYNSLFASEDFKKMFANTILWTFGN